MEILKTQTPKLILPFVILLLSNIIYAQAVTPAGSIERTTKQQLLASIPPSHEPTPTGSSQLFLTSPSGKYTVYLLRRETSIGAGGFGSDFCYLQVQESGTSVWESECTVVSNVNTCTLVFSDAGLEIFDGSNSAWDTDVDIDEGQHLETLVLVDTGDMQIRDKEGELVWKARDNPIVNQNCGSVGAPGLAPAHPPFGSPIHGRKGPFGQPLQNQGQQRQSAFQQQQQQQQLGSPQQSLAPPVSDSEQLGSPQQSLAPPVSGSEQLGSPEQSLGEPVSDPEQLGSPQQSLGHPVSDSDKRFSSSNQPLGRSSQQPLVDNTPFDSGTPNGKHFKFEIVLVCLVGLLGYFGFLL